MIPEAITRIKSYVDHPKLGPTARHALKVFTESCLLSHEWSTMAQSSSYVSQLYRFRAKRIVGTMPGLYESIECLGERDVQVHSGNVELSANHIVLWVSEEYPDIAGIMIFSYREAATTPRLQT